MENNNRTYMTGINGLVDFLRFALRRLKMFEIIELKDIINICNEYQIALLYVNKDENDNFLFWMNKFDEFVALKFNMNKTNWHDVISKVTPTFEESVRLTLLTLDEFFPETDPETGASL